MPDDTQTLINYLPREVANKAIIRNISIASSLPWLLVFVQAGRFDDATSLVDTLVGKLTDADADLRTLRDAVSGPFILRELHEGKLPYAYTKDHKCAICGNPLRYPLVWNRTTKDTGEHICAHDECNEEGEPDCDTAG